MKRLALVIAFGLAACGPHTGPDMALDSYAHALHAQDFDAAYALMSSSFRAKVSRDEFVRMLKDNPREVQDTAARLDGRHEHLEVSAELAYGLGDSMRLVQENGHWRIASDPLAFYDQSTPHAALRSFLRAYRLQRWDVMLRFLPDKYREHMDVAKMKDQFEGQSREQTEVLMNMLEANVDAPIVEKGNEARMSYGERNEVKFVREDGAWKLKDLD
ncbi:MAG TPA: hypothetical protein VL463_01565 [Kofleriaceae bacterium]|jgi:hypothetical protein|nr:hypothetical protein [Kofleriaceae bacterium]